MAATAEQEPIVPGAAPSEDAHKWRALISVSLAIMMVGLDGTVVSVANPTIGALMLPATLACLQTAFPPDELERAVGIWGGTSALAIAGGPIVGGLLVQNVSWESIFPSRLAFLDGLHSALIVGAIVAFAGVLLSLLVQRGHEVDGPAGAV